MNITTTGGQLIINNFTGLSDVIYISKESVSSVMRRDNHIVILYDTGGRAEQVDIDYALLGTIDGAAKIDILTDIGIIATAVGSDSLPSKYTEPVVLATNYDITGGWTDIGAEIDMREYTQLLVYIDLTIGTSTNVQIQALGKTESGGADEYNFAIETVGASDVKIEDEYIEFNVDANQKVILKIKTEGVPYIQLQGNSDADGTGTIDVKTNKIWR